MRRRLTVLAVALSGAQADYHGVKSVSSQTLAQRMADAESDYWRAVDAFRNEDFVETKQAASAAFLHLDFARKLMKTETAERELGEGNLFELGYASDDEANTQRVQSALSQLTAELAEMLESARTQSM
jgi:hypothetical protein